MTWSEVAELGAVWPPDGKRSWHVGLWVRFAEGQPKRRVRITWAPGLGRIRTRAEAVRVLEQVRAQCVERPLREVIATYQHADVPENQVIHRFEQEMLPEMQRRYRTGEIGKDRLGAFEKMVPRGYLGFWRGVSVYAVTEGLLVRWLGWLRDEYPHLKPVSLRHVVRDFGTFLRWMQTIGTLREVPRSPVVKVPKQPRRVPTRESLWRILEAIPDERRGLWLARALAGLRPAEARSLDMIHYRDGTLHISGDIAKTDEPRWLKVDVVAPELDAWIRKYRGSADPWEPLFPNPLGLSDDKRWRYHAEWKCWERACKAAGVEHVRPNWGGRHHFATHEIKGGTAPIGVQKWMGHKRFSTTQVYVDEFDEVELARVMRPRAWRAKKKTSADRRST